MMENPSAVDVESAASGDGLHVSGHDTSSHHTCEFVLRLKRVYPKAYEHEPFINPNEIQCKQSYKFHDPDENKKIIEPLAGFLSKQDEIAAQVFKPYYYIPDVVDPPYETPRKTRFIKERPIKISVFPKGKPIDDLSTNSEEELDPPVFACQLELINNLRNHPEIGFYYMIYAVERSSKYFNPYALKVVKYKEVGESYLTLGFTGVTQYTCEEAIFTSTEEWIREYTLYGLLTKIKTFGTYSLWKPLYVWRRFIRHKKIKLTIKNLNANLFACNPILSPAMLEINEMCSIFLHCSLVDTTRRQKIPIFYFIEIQFAKLEKIMDRSKEFREITINILGNACLSSLFDDGFTPDDSNITIEQTIIGKTGGRLRLPKDGILRMCFIEQARKREKCARLSSFIRTVEYYQFCTLHNSLRNTYEELVEILELQFKVFSLVIEDDQEEEKDDGKEPEKKCQIQLKKQDQPNENSTLDDELEKIREEIQYPYFEVDLSINVDGISLDPSEKIIRNVLKSLESEWEKHLSSIHSLITDENFYSFTRPLIDNKIENATCGRPPDLLDTFKEDKVLQQYKKRMTSVLDDNFAAVRNYVKRFKTIHNYYCEDMSFDENEIRTNERLDIFREWCERYREEETEINELTDFQLIGFFYIKFEKFKREALPAPNNKQKVLAEVLPVLGKKKVQDLMVEATEAVEFLAVDPVTTEDYVEYIKFVDAAQKMIDTMESELDYVKELYDIMEEYEFPVEKEDMANYLGISVHFTSLRLSVDKCLEERIKLITRFNTQIQKDINRLIDKIQAIDEEVSQPWLLEPDSSIESVMEVLNDLNVRLTECINLSNDYRSFQKTFKVEMTRFEVLDQVMNEVKLRILLWDSLTQWDVMIQNWYEMEFEELDVEEVTNYVIKNVKSIQQLEKGLRQNEVLPLLIDKVEDLKNKLPVISSLRNPNLRSRHWIKIEGLLKHKFKPDEEPLNLKLFDELGAFKYPEELAEIASAASSEAGLEVMLAKVDEAWKALDFIVMKHKDQKDVFVLGSLEEVQAALDDSNITIQTVAASRHVGPVKPRVDDWVRRLELFTKTLDAWQYCQMQWMYLEAIFSAPDIQRQLPVESKLFIQVDKSWKEIMRKTAKMPLALENCTLPGLYEQLIENNQNLEIILKCLEAYLETKCIAFPRFFFLSNDELLEILAQTRNPQAVQRHLQKCFDAIFRLQFAASNQQGGQSNDILAMTSPEGEIVEFSKGLKARGNVEDWLGKVEAAMFSILKKKMKEAIKDFAKKGRQFVIHHHASQIVLTVSQIFWAKDAHKALESKNPILSLKKFEKKCFENLNKLAAMVRGVLPKLIRDVITNLVTIDVHARDTISILVEKKVTSSSSFDWLKALRYYWNDNLDTCLARMSNAEYKYGYEYLGAQRRLVITPLTDKCYMCLVMCGFDDKKY